MKEIAIIYVLTLVTKISKIDTNLITYHKLFTKTKKLGNKVTLFVILRATEVRK